MAEGAGQLGQDGNQPGGPEVDGAELADRHPAEPVAGLDAAVQIVGRQRGRPGDPVVQADLMLEGPLAEDVLHDQRQRPGRQFVPEFLGQLADESHVAGFAEADPPAGQEPVVQAVNRAQQHLVAADDDGRHPQVERPGRAAE